MRNKLSVLLTAATIAAAGLVHAAVQDVTLRYRWNKGETQQYRMTQESAVSMSNVPGMGEMNVTTTIAQVLEYTIADVAADGSGTVRVKFASIKMGLNSPMGSMVWDSASPSAAADPMTTMMAGMLKPLVGESITMVVSPAGAVSKIEGLDALAAKMNAGAAAPAGLPGMGSIMTEDSLRSMFEQSFAAFPDKPIKVGESWAKDNTIKMPFGTVSSAARLALQNLAGGVATITYKATNKVKVDNTATAGMPMSMTMGDGTTDGELAFDVKAGRIQKSTLRTVQPMSMNTTGPDGSPVNMNATTRTTMTVELVK